MITLQLRELEADGVIERHVYAEETAEAQAGG
jgi:DNA-binding HxlR family transcriptional regulator